MAIEKEVKYLIDKNLLKNMNEDESVKLKYILALGAVISPYGSYVVYNTRDNMEQLDEILDNFRSEKDKEK